MAAKKKETAKKTAPKKEEVVAPVEETVETAPVAEETATPEVTESEAPVSEVVEPQEDPRANEVVEIESVDGRTLELNVNGNAYVGKTIRVPKEIEGEARRVLTSGNFLIK